MNYSPHDIYLEFRRASGKPFRAPKNWDDHLNNKMKHQNREALLTLTAFFNTKWRNINVTKYMSCGFELFPTFTYVKFFDDRIINLYISKDKVQKRECELDKRKIIESAKFIKSQMKNLGISTLKQYARYYNENESLAVSHYLQGHVDSILLTYLIYEKYIFLDDNISANISYILTNMRSLKSKVLSIIEFLKNVEEKMNE